MNEKKNFLNNRDKGNEPKMPRFNMNWIYLLVAIVAGVFLLSGGGNMLAGDGANQEASYTKFKQYVAKGYATSVVVNKEKSTLKMYVAPKHIQDVFHMNAKQVGTRPYVNVAFGSVDELEKFLTYEQKAGKIVDFSYDNDSGSSIFNGLLFQFGPLLLLILFWFWIMRRMSGGGNVGGGGGIFSVGKSKAKLYEKANDLGITFKDVAGQEGAKQEVQEIVEFLKNPQKYTELGGKIPKGALLVGPPGTGKTLLAKAVAGEAGVPFFSMSGSDFVEMFVGVGASRVRDLFEQAKKESPAIVFIDEIDAVGRKRGAGLGGGHDEREQTLNQLLVEMDGFGINQGIIIMAATNRPDILDPALLRPGRFDRQIVVGRPDVKGREAIFKVHSKNKPLEDDVDLSVLAKFTAGFTPADIENVMNEAAILTARKRENKISMETIEEAITKTVVGVAKKSRIITEKERILTAYHEAGHAVCAHVLNLMDPVHQVTIIPRGMAGGFTMQLPTEDKYYATRGEMLQPLTT